MTPFERLDAATRTRWVAGLLLAILFLYRLIFGLCCEFWAEDERQIYIIGLKFFTTGRWPYFGPDLVLKNHERVYQIPGALQGLLVGLPFYVLRLPEAPFLLLNLLSFAALGLLAWYGCRRVPSLPPWFVFGLALTLPWTLHYSTRVINPSYVLAGSIVFFIGAFEALVFTDDPILPRRLADASMGFGLLWVMQLHMSWVVLVPFFLFSLYGQVRSGQGGSAFLFQFLGALPVLSLLLPTYLRYGFTTGNDLHGFLSRFNWINVANFPVLLARYLSLASFELPRFLGDHTHQRIDYLLQSPWLLLPGLFLWLAGYVQPLLMLVLGFLPSHPRSDWNALRILALGTLAVLFGCFLFTPYTPAPFRIYSVFPVIMLYSLYCWDGLASRRAWRWVGLCFIVSAVFFQVGYLWKEMNNPRSVYAQKHDLMTEAIQRGDYRILSERRPGSLY